MSILKIKKTSNFSVIDNKIINDNRLSWKARGILIYLLSKPDDWEVQFKDIVHKSDKDGEIAVRNAMKELVQFGYAKLFRGHFKSENGLDPKIGSYYEIYEQPNLGNDVND